MFELRWLDKGGTKVLQYRYKFTQTVYSYPLDSMPDVDRTETVWSKWQDVPVVMETKE